MFIVFEGIDASGKSTLIKALSDKLTEKSLQYIVTREPGGTPLAEEIRELLLKNGEDAPTPRCELLLYQASRAQHVEKVIEPALKKDQWVLCDRFTASSLAFQCGGRGVSEADVNMLNNYSTAGRQPDITVLLDISVDESEKRKNSRVTETGVEKDRFEIEKIEFHSNVRNHYLKQAEENPKAWLVISGEKSPKDVLDSFLEGMNL